MMTHIKRFDKRFDMTSRRRNNFGLIVCKTSPVKTKHYHLQMLYLSILAVKQEKLTVDHLSVQG